LTGVLVASACALLGVFLVLRRMAMMADAISHAILPGLVAGYVAAQGPDLLAGFAGAVLAAVVTVSLVEWLQNTRRMSGESAIGIIFPAMFALGTLVVSRSFANVHLDADAILYGNIEFTPFDALYVGETNLGPQSLWVMAGLCLLNLLFVGLFYKELKLATFDAGLAAALGFSPALIHYAFMTVLSITTVGAFTAVGAILVVALLIVPAAAAYLLTDRLPRMIGLAVAIGAFSAVAGYGAAIALDASVAGAMATAAGLCFGAAFFFSPRQGLAVKAWQLRRRRLEFAVSTLVVHLLNHERAADQAEESAVEHLSGELRWRSDFARRVIDHAAQAGLLQRANGQLDLTPAGRDLALRRGGP
jgi:manganese/zinc/iron transport system permease protein